jgi:Uma2 family endonuclease
MEFSLDINKRYTYADYLTWMDDKMRELVHGFIRIMSPSPTARHQETVMNLGSGIHQIIRKSGCKCKVFPAPFDVRFPKNGETTDNKIDTVVQPDICVVCDLSKIDNRGCLGAPDLVAEVLSSSTARYDLTEKFDLYEASGVCEYWIAYPFENVIEAFILQPNGTYDKGTKYYSGKVPIHIFNGTEIDLTDIF